MTGHPVRAANSNGAALWRKKDHRVNQEAGKLSPTWALMMTFS